MTPHRNLSENELFDLYDHVTRCVSDMSSMFENVRRVTVVYGVNIPETIMVDDTGFYHYMKGLREELRSEIALKAQRATFAVLAETSGE